MTASTNAPWPMITATAPRLTPTCEKNMSRASPVTIGGSRKGR